MQEELYFLRNFHQNFGLPGSSVHSCARTSCVKDPTIDCKIQNYSYPVYMIGEPPNAILGQTSCLKMPKQHDSVPESVSGFTVLPLHIPPLPSCSVSTTHYIYVRPHTPKIADPDSERSLYLINIPIDSTLTHFRHLFSAHLGGYRVERVDFDETKTSKKAAQRAQVVSGEQRGKKRKRGQNGEEKPDLDLPVAWDRDVHKSGSAAVCVFVDVKSAKAAMKAVKRAVMDKATVEWGGSEVDAKVPPLGSTRYKRHDAMRFPSHELLQEAADKYMTAFGSFEEARKRRLAKQRSEADEDGFITVTRGGKEGPARTQETIEKLAIQKKKQKEKADGMTDFYRFQNRDRKKAAEKELLRQFEEDKKKVEEMRRVKGGKDAFTPM